jgi:hypothetical protein
MKRRSKSKFKKVILYKTSNEDVARSLASWLSKQSKLIKCSVRKSVTVRGINFIVTLKYKISIRATTLIQIGYQLCALTNGSVMTIERQRKPYIAIQNLSLSENPTIPIATENQLSDDLPF